MILSKNFLYVLAIFAAFLLVRYFYFMPKLVFGASAPPFSEIGIDQNEVTLDHFKGSYVLLDFWGSWCAPCRQENKILTMLHERYDTAQFKSANGLKIISIALESDTQQAISAIKKDGLNWKSQIIQTNMLESSLASLYGIKQIPFKFLIGPDLKIILSDPDMKELDDYLAHNLK